MSENTNAPAPQKPDEAAATAPAEPEAIPADLLKLVKRPGEKEGRLVAVKRDEVLTWREHPDRVVVVTTDGQKLVGSKPEAAAGK